MCKARRVMKTIEKSAPGRYFDLSTKIMALTGMYPLGAERSQIIRSLYSTYFFFLFFFTVVLTPVTRAMALSYLTNIDEVTENTSFVLNHIMGVFKIVVFMSKRKDLITLVETIQSSKFRHQDCSETFSANRLIRGAVRISEVIYYFFSSFIVSLVLTSILRVFIKQSELQVISTLNDTESATAIERKYHRQLPFHGWFPFSTEISPNHEIVFVYQMVAVVTSAYMVMALDTMLVGFMAHIKVQFQILAHNLRFIKPHAQNIKCENSSAIGETVSQTMFHRSERSLIKAMESDLEIHVAHHQAIIQLSEDLESVFTNQILLQFICSLLSLCMLLWQVSSTPILSTKFVSMFFYFVAVGVQLFMYCWFGNEVMLESLSVADAAWNSGWQEISSRRYSHGIAMIIQRSQNVVTITAGGFADLTLETFMSISQAAYSFFAVLKKMNG